MNSNKIRAHARKVSRAMDLMRRPGSRLLQMRVGENVRHYITSGGYVEPDVAEAIKNHPQVLAGEDGLWPGHSQTWQSLPSK